jgi:hypothetical protein
VVRGTDYRLHATEGEFQEAVISLARLYGWKVAHFRPARTEKGWRTAMQGDKGFPDLVLAKQGRVIFAELKAHGKNPTTDQTEWLAALQGNEKAEVYVWRPEDMEQVRMILDR